MTKFLLDTHTLIWAALRPSRLTAPVAEIIRDEEHEILVSAASAWEIATKVRKGKLPEAIEFEQHFMNDIAEAGYTHLPITTEDALRAGRLVGAHGDPFDRILAAQALARDIPILSNDEELDVFGVRRLW